MYCFFTDRIQGQNVDHNNDVSYCSLCDKWLCESCRVNYKERIKAAFDEKVRQNPIVRKLVHSKHRQ